MLDKFLEKSQELQKNNEPFAIAAGGAARSAQQRKNRR